MSTLIRRDPNTFGDLISWMENELGGFPAQGKRGPAPMRIEDYVEDGNYVVRAELPGIDPDKDVEITIANGLLQVRAERREETKDDQRSEFRYGSFSRTVTLPAGADAAKAKATYKDGVLQIRIPVPKPAKPEVKRLAITKG